MTSPKLTVIGLLAVAAIAVGACGNATVTPTPTAIPTPTPTPVVTAPPPTPAPTPTPTPAPTPHSFESMPADQLVVPGHLTVCSDLPHPPAGFFDAAGDPTGSDIEIGAEIAKRLGLKVAVQNTLANGMVAALAGHKCDVTISGQRITATLLKAIDMIPYFQTGEGFVVAKGNPSGIKTVYDLCNKSIGVIKGSVEDDHLNGRGIYTRAHGLIARCQAARLTALVDKPFTKDSDALAALAANKIAAYFVDLPAAGYAAIKQPDQFEFVSGLTLNPATEGIGLSRNAGEAYAAIRNALQSMIDDGTYLQILKKYGLEACAIASTTP